MNDKFEPFDHGPYEHEPLHHGPHPWGPHGPDGPMVHAYVWPDVYHPVPYGKEWKGNENLTLCGGEHWCPPRDHGRHGCHPEPCGCGGHAHLPCDFTKVMDDYIDVMQKYIHATTYQERCDCVNELARIKVKIKEILKEMDKQVYQNEKDIMRLSNKVTYYIGKVQSMQEDFHNNMLRQDELEAAFNEMKTAFEELEEAWKTHKDTTYTLSYAGDTLTLTDSNGVEQSVVIAPDTNTTYQISKSGNTITLTGSDGSTTTVQVAPDTNTTYTLSANASGEIVLTGSDGSSNTVRGAAPEATSADVLAIFA